MTMDKAMKAVGLQKHELPKDSVAAKIQEENAQFIHLKEQLDKSREAFKMVLPANIPVDKMIRMTLTTVRKSPALLSCNRASVLGAVMQCAQLGLEPDNNLGYAYFVPFSGQCQLIVGYRGMLELARRSGEVVRFVGRVVYAEDDFHYEYGINETIRHIPSLELNVGAPVHYYVIAYFKDGSYQFEVMSAKQMSPFKRTSDAWLKHPEQMALKTVARRLFKWLPVGVDLGNAIALDDAAANGRQDNEQIGKDIIDGTYTQDTGVTGYIKETEVESPETPPEHDVTKGDTDLNSAA